MIDLVTHSNLICDAFWSICHTGGLWPPLLNCFVVLHPCVCRSMSLSNNNIMHKAICPDTTNTELVAAAGKGLDPKMLEENIKMLGGLMTPEFVAEAHLVFF